MLCTSWTVNQTQTLYHRNARHKYEELKNQLCHSTHPPRHQRHFPIHSLSLTSKTITKPTHPIVIPPILLKAVTSHPTHRTQQQKQQKLVLGIAMPTP